MKGGWEEKTIGDVCLKTSNIKWNDHAEEYFEYVDLSSVSRELSEIVNSTKINNGNAPSRAKKIIRTGDVIFATTRPTLKRAAIVSEVFDNQICSTGFAVLRKNDELVLPEYLFYFLHSDEFMQRMAKLQRGASYPAVTDSDVKKTKIRIPHIEKQKQIVAILDQAFAAIDQAQANIQQNIQNAQDLFQSKLNQIFSKQGEDWDQKTFKEICSVITDGTHQTPKYFDSGYIFLSSKNVTSGKIDWDNVKYLDEEQHNKMYKRLAPQINDILLAKNGTTGVAAIVDVDKVFDIYVSLALLRPTEIIYPYYLLHFINSIKAKDQFNKRLKGIGVPNLHLKEIREVEINYPIDISKQQEISDFIDELLIQRNLVLDKYEAKLSNLEELKKSLLQKAFSGDLTKEVIVNDVEAYETTSPEFAANVIAFAYFQHTKKNKENTFGHVKAQKLLHLTESIVGVNLGRNPQKDAAGPNDFQHMLKAERWAKTHKYFKFTKRPKGYSFEKLQNFDDLIAKANSVLSPYEQKLTDLVSLLVPMKSRQAEVFATVHAAWNNMILDNKEITDESIVYEARDNWHEDKLKIRKEEFEKAIDNIRAKNLEPNGTAKRVIGQEKLL